MNIEFFERLYADPKFCAQLGQVTLAAGRFESNLRAYLTLRHVDVPAERATLGTLIKKLKDNDLLSENGVQVLRGLKDQRNYLTHSLFDLFSARVDETLLPRTDLVPMDVTVFTEKTWDLEQNLAGLDRIVEKEISRLKAQKPGAHSRINCYFVRRLWEKDCCENRANELDNSQNAIRPKRTDSSMALGSGGRPSMPIRSTRY